MLDHNPIVVARTVRERRAVRTATEPASAPRARTETAAERVREPVETAAGRRAGPPSRLAAEAHSRLARPPRRGTAALAATLPSLDAIPRREVVVQGMRITLPALGFMARPLPSLPMRGDTDRTG